MSRHWKEDSRERWLRPEAYDALTAAEKRQLWRERKAARRARASQWPRGATVGLALVAATCLGLAVGITQAMRADPVQPGAEIEWNAVQAVPVGTKSAEDLAWERRAKGEDGPSTLRPGSGQASSGRTEEGVRLSFGSCTWGGGTNCVVDGDTFYIGGQKVRVAGVDAPETHDYRCASELALGNEATERLRALLNSGAVTMTNIDRDRDKYGRLLRNVQVNGEDVGEALISARVAREYGGGRRSWC